MRGDDERARKEFTSEAEELLEQLSRDLSEFEAQGRDVRPEVINKIFREVHSLKGLAGMLGFVEIAELAHNLEDMLDRLRMGKIEITGELLDLLYDAVDSLNRLVISISDPSIEGLVDVSQLTTRIHRLTSSGEHSIVDDPLEDLDIDDQTRKSLTEYEEHRLAMNVSSGKGVYSIEVTFDFSDFDEKLRSLSERLNQAGEVISTLPSVDPAGGAGLSFRLLFGSSSAQSEIAAAAGEGANIRSLRSGRAELAAIERSAEDDVSLRSVGQTVRVDIRRLDHVMNIVGELLIERTQLDTISRSDAAQENRALARELLRITRNFDRRLNELQRSVIEMRMVPVGQIYAKLSRAVRKLARELEKEIELLLHGEDTELDKVMVEELTDPLLHLIRNAIDHGIEPKEERIAAGKPAAGQVRLNAYQKGNSVVIDVADDGKGIDPEKVRATALRRGLMREEDQLSERQVTELIFSPGFSTAQTVSEVSGRGVGLDVVKRNLQELKGSIEILSEPGRGSTFRITLPITLAIIQGLIVDSSEQRFAVPLTSVDEILRIWGSEIRTVEGREVYKLRETTLPLLRLSDAFRLGEGAKQDGDRKWFVIVTRTAERVTGLLVDRIVRQQEIVIKSVGDRLKRIPGIAGATEIGENEAILVVDTGSLIDHFGSSARSSRRSREHR
jgi:two-component system, chemotaxis family, sensor kinase CheA